MPKYIEENQSLIEKKNSRGYLSVIFIYIILATIGLIYFINMLTK